MKPDRSLLERTLLAPPILVAAAGLASCTLLQPKDPGGPALRAVSVQQTGDGRFMTCLDCEAPTPKSLASAVTPSSADRVVLQRPPALPVPVDSMVRPQAAQGTTAWRVERATLNFANDSATLDPRAEQVLVALRPLLAQARTLRIVGFTDDVGTQTANDHLADARALSVLVRLRAILGGDGRTGPELSATGHAKCCYLNDNAGERQRASNRRVELVLSLEDNEATNKLVAQHARWLNQRESTTKVAHDVHARR